MTRGTRLAFITTVIGVPLAVATFAQAVRPVEPDPWSITAEDDAAVLDVYRKAAGNLDDKLRAAVKADRARLKSRVVVESAKPSRRVWLDTSDGKALVDLDVYTSVIITDKEVEFRESGFTTLRAPKTAALTAHLRAYYGAVDLAEQGEAK